MFPFHGRKINSDPSGVGVSGSIPTNYMALFKICFLANVFV